MDNILQQAENRLFSDSDLDLDIATKSLKLLLERKIDFGDLFFEQTASEGFSLEDGIVNSGSFDISRGVGVRCVTGGKSGFAYSDVLDNASLKDACTASRTISVTGNEFKTCITPKISTRAPLYSSNDPLIYKDPRS